jgi:hypothetical protein
VRAHYAALAQATPANVAEVLAERSATDWHWRGMHPFHEQHGAKAVAAAFWAPFLTAMARVQRRQDIFIAGHNEKDPASAWVVSMGHLMGLFDAPFLGIWPTRRIAMLRYAEFNRVESGKIAETAMFFDIPHLMIQAGQNPFPPATGAHLVQPGPVTHDGLLYQDADPTEGVKTLAAINNMIDDIRRWQNAVPIEEELARSWTDDMIWWGPAGIGATYTISRYAEQHAGPFRAAFADRKFNGHVCRLAEGHFGGFFGWANLTLTHKGGFMGLPGNPVPADMRVVDMYRREGDKLAENWIFIDILHFLNMQGLDVLGRIATL